MQIGRGRMALFPWLSFPFGCDFLAPRSKSSCDGGKKFHHSTYQGGVMWTCLMKNGHDRRIVGGERATGQRGGGLFSMIKFVRWICFWHPEASGVVAEVRNMV